MYKGNKRRVYLQNLKNILENKINYYIKNQIHHQLFN